MNSIKNKIKKETIAICALSFVLLFTIVITVSYSYISSNISKSTIGNFSASSVKGESLTFLKGEAINQPVYEDEKSHIAITRPVVLYTPDNNKEHSSTTYNGYLNIINNTIVSFDSNEEAVLLKIKKPDGTYVNSVDGLEFNNESNTFNITNKTGMFRIVTDYEIGADKGNETIHTWEIEILLSDNVININKNAGNEIDTDISFTKGEYVQ